MNGRTGDVFVIPVGDDRVAVGQIVQQGSSTQMPWVAVFWPPIDDDDLERQFPAQIATAPVLLGQAIMLRGRWRRVANAEVIAPIPWPAFKVSTAPGVFQVVGHDGVAHHQASEGEIESLPFMSSWSSASFEHAIAALAGLQEWNDFHNRLRPSPYTEASVLGEPPE